jgi:aminopeptidase N
VNYTGNIYTKGGWVLRMLRWQLGDENFWTGLHHYLEVNRGQNVVTADLQKAIEQATSVNVDKFFYQWVLRAGAPKFEVSYGYDGEKHEVKLEVKQTQKVEGMVPLFDVPLEVEIATAGGRKTTRIEVSKADETFTFPADSAPAMVVFDKGDHILKSVEFKKDPALWIYQLKNGETASDRADAAVALGAVKDNAEAVAALGEAAEHDAFWGVRVEALKALGKIGGPSAEKQVLEALDEQKPWVREVAVEQLGEFKDDAEALAPKLTKIAASDKAWKVRAVALGSLAGTKAGNACVTLATAVKSESPDDTIRIAALRALGKLGDERAVPVLLEWSALGKPLDSRGAAIGALAGMDKGNKEITRALISYMREPYFGVKFPAIIGLGRRGDPDAIAPLEDLVKSGELSIGITPFVERQIAGIKAQAAGKAINAGENAANPHEGSSDAAGAGGASTEAVMEHLEKLEHEMQEMNARLGKIETQLNGGKQSSGANR